MEPQKQLVVGSASNHQHDAESRKKRDSRAVHNNKAGRRDEHDVHPHDHDGASSSSSDHGPEQSKKLRAEERTTTTTTAAAVSAPPTAQHQPENRLDPSTSIRRRLDPEAVTEEQQEEVDAARAAAAACGVLTEAPVLVLDLEVALQRVVRMNHPNGTTITTSGNAPSQPANEDEATNKKEFLSLECWVNFRVGHAGDASTLASWYQISQERNVNESVKEKNNGEEDTSMEVRLAEGLGDEDTPPTIFALIADVSFHGNNNDKAENKSMMGAAALLSIIRDEPRVLNVEWLHVSDDDKLTAVASLLRRRMWLRLSALALMTSCTTLVAPNKMRRHEVIETAGTQAKPTVDQQRSDTSSDRL